MVSQQLLADCKEKFTTFRRYCKSRILEKNIQADHIINMDEVPLTFDMLLNRTKLPPIVIFKRKMLPKETFPAGIIVKVNPKGWMDEEIMKNWLSEVYVQRPNGFFCASPALLVYDSMRAHKTESVKILVKKTNSEFAGFAKANIIPGLTSDGIESIKTDDSNDEDLGDTGSGLLDTAITQLMISDTEDEEFEGFIEEE
ncbi:hypothetical protein TURU_059562 [Turdus rufiventris]|nr:hypothetical protein TURU_059562 [Turdus rufiventris]